MIFFDAKSQVATGINWCAAILPVRYPVFITHLRCDGGLLGVHWQLDAVWNWRREKCIGRIAVFTFLPVSPSGWAVRKLLLSLPLPPDWGKADRQHQKAPGAICEDNVTPLLQPIKWGDCWFFYPPISSPLVVSIITVELGGMVGGISFRIKAPFEEREKKVAGWKYTTRRASRAARRPRSTQPFHQKEIDVAERSQEDGKNAAWGAHALMDSSLAKRHLQRH